MPSSSRALGDRHSSIRDYSGTGNTDTPQVAGEIQKSMQHQPIFINACEQYWLRRVIRLSGAVESVLELDARRLGIGIGGAEQLIIRVDRTPLGAWPVDPPWVRYELAFPVPTWKRSATIEVQFSDLGVYQLRYFKLTIGGTVLYEEGNGKVLRMESPPPLPVPAAAPSPGPEELPIPTEYDPTP